MKKHIPFLLLHTLIFLQSSAIAMDPLEIKEFPQSAKIVFVAPPEYVEAMNAIQALASLCPQIAQENPIIRSKEEFEAAKVYLGLTKKYNHLLFTGAIYGPPGQEIKDTLIQNCSHVLNGLQSYIKTLQGEPCIAFRNKTDDLFLEHEMYDVLYKTVQNHLMLLMKAALIPDVGKTPLLINPHVQAIKSLKEQLSPHAEYRKKLRKEIEQAQELVPAVYFLLNPHLQARPLQSSKQSNKRITRQKTVNYYQKFSEGLDGVFHDNVCNFDPHFQTTSMTLLTNYLALCVKKISLEEYAQDIQKLTEDYLSLEKKGMEFKVLFGLPSPSPTEDSSLPSNDLTELYDFFCKRYETPNKSPLELLEASIFMFIQANKVEEALKRTEILKTFVLKRGPLPEKFQALRASVMALNGNPEEWRKILENKKNHAQEAKTAAEQKKVDQIKRQQTRIKKEQGEAEKLKKDVQNNIKEKKIQEATTEPKEWFDYTQIFSEEKTEPASKHAALPKKIKTRKDPQELCDDKPQKSIPSLPLEIKETPQFKDYSLSQNAYKIYHKIRRGDWKFSRQNLSNLFQKLECTVDFSQGKGCHGKISAPLDMMIRHKQELIAVIPEFIQTELPFPLTIPDWDEKWSGIVPHYMRKSIVSALDYLGATNETVHKSNNPTK